MVIWGPLPEGAARAVRALGDPRARPNREWLRRLLDVAPDRIRAIVTEMEELEPLEAGLRRAHLEGGRSFYAQFRAPLELYALVRILRPKHIIETGVSSGVSSAHFLAGLQRVGSGVLHSIDLPAPQKSVRLDPHESVVSLPPGHSSGWAAPARLKQDWDLRLGRSQDLLPPLVDELPQVDIFLHDSFHTPSHLTFELTNVARKLKPGSVVLADNTAWTGQSFPRFAARIDARVLRRGQSDLVGLRVPPTFGPDTV